MSAPLHIEETTIRDLALVLCPHNAHSKLARSAAEFFVEEHMRPVTDREFAEPTIDTRTMRRLIQFLIERKGYN